MRDGGPEANNRDDAKEKYDDFRWAVGRKSLKRTLSFMLGIGILMTQGDPGRLEVIACQGVSYFIVIINGEGSNLR